VRYEWSVWEVLFLPVLDFLLRGFPAPRSIFSKNTVPSFLLIWISIRPGVISFFGWGWVGGPCPVVWDSLTAAVSNLEMFFSPKTGPQPFFLRSKALPPRFPDLGHTPSLLLPSLPSISSGWPVSRYAIPFSHSEHTLLCFFYRVNYVIAFFIILPFCFFPPPFRLLGFQPAPLFSPQF